MIHTEGMAEMSFAIRGPFIFIFSIVVTVISHGLYSIIQVYFILLGYQNDWPLSKEKEKYGITEKFAIFMIFANSFIQIVKAQKE